MEEHSVPVAYLILPILLPLAQCALLQQAVSLDDELRSCSLESYTTLDTDDGVTHVAVATDSVRSTNLLNLLDGCNLIIKLLAVDSYNLTLLEGNLQLSLFFLGSNVLQISLLWETLGWVENLTTADTGSPDTYVIRILQLGEVCIETVLVQVVNLLLTRKRLVTGQCDDLYTRSHNQEGHVETDLVVAGTCTSVSDGISTNLLGVTSDGDSLEDTLRRYRDRVAVVAEHITENHVFQ